jgi:hypothetical protein
MYAAPGTGRRCREDDWRESAMSTHPAGAIVIALLPFVGTYGIADPGKRGPGSAVPFSVDIWSGLQGPRSCEGG